VFGGEDRAAFFPAQVVRVVSGVRGMIGRLERDLEILDENHAGLASELRETVCNEEPTDS
jgi:hypothetical protein